MLTREGCHARVDRLRGALDAALAGVLISDPKHVHRLVNFWPPTGSLGNDHVHHLLVTGDGHTVLMVDNWLAGRARQSYAHEVAVCDWYTGRAPATDRVRSLAAFVPATLRDRGLRGAPLGVEMPRLQAAVYAELGGTSRLVDVWEVSYSQRVCKDEDEIDAIRTAIRVAEAAHRVGREQACDGLSEIELLGRMMDACTVEQGDPAIMLCDLASGDRTCAGGGPATRRVMHDGELLILDLFPLVGGYRGDITNTLCVGGHPTDRQQQVFDVLVAAIHSGEQTLCPGRTGGDVYRAVEATIAEAGYRGRFTHHAGHGIGLGHPESPFLVPESDEALCPGHVVTMEPGIYIPDWGGMRIEHNYVITDHGFERLSAHHVGLV